VIRKATVDDLPCFMRLAAEMHRESRFRDWSFDEGKVGTLFLKMVQDPDSFVWVACEDDVVIGGLVGMVYEQWFSTERVAQDLGLFLHPAHRGGLNALRLVKAFKAWATEQGARDCELGVNTGVEPQRTGAFLQCLGFREVAQLYSMEVRPCA
jgi:GNAT superfamily N-acetyltransferase